MKLKVDYFSTLKRNVLLHGPRPCAVLVVGETRLPISFYKTRPGFNKIFCKDINYVPKLRNYYTLHWCFQYNMKQ